MNKKKFIRLFIVSFIPLLIFGVITAKIIFHYYGSKYSAILCTPSMGIGTDFCRQLGNIDGTLYQSVKGQYPAWFDVQVGDYDENAPLKNFIMASTRVVWDAQIVKASPFTGYDSAVPFMNSLVGRKASVNLGIQDNRRSFISNEINILYCNDLEYKSNEGEYTSRCFGDGWSGFVTYRAIGTSREELDKLLISVNEEVESRKLEYDIYRVIMYPIFIYLFLLISLFVWIFKKAAKFVNG